MYLRMYRECAIECTAKKNVPEMYRECAIECNTNLDCWEEIGKEAPRWMETLREHQIHKIGIDSFTKSKEIE